MLAAAANGTTLTFKATGNCSFFVRAKYTLPNLPLDRGRPISKSARHILGSPGALLQFSGKSKGFASGVPRSIVTDPLWQSRGKPKNILTQIWKQSTLPSNRILLMHYTPHSPPPPPHKHIIFTTTHRSRHSQNSLQQSDLSLSNLHTHPMHRHPYCVACSLLTVSNTLPLPVIISSLTLFPPSIIALTFTILHFSTIHISWISCTWYRHQQHSTPYQMENLLGDALDVA